jgi:hypothetical protein
LSLLVGKEGQVFFVDFRQLLKLDKIHPAFPEFAFPYGEKYDAIINGGGYSSFVNLPMTMPTIYDTPNRELLRNSGRWLSPDPAHASWNAYSYPTDPNTGIDPSGLDPCDSNPTECGDSVPGGDFPSDVYANPAPAVTRPLLSLLLGLLDALFGGGGSITGDAPGEVNAWNYMGESANYMVSWITEFVSFRATPLWPARAA